MPKLMLVLGMHRSGTSALTRSLILAGLEGPRRLLHPDQANRRGFWESPDVVFLNDEILMAAGRYWFDPRPLQRQNTEHFIDRAVKVLEDNYSGTSDAVLKDPRLCRVGTIWAKAAERLKYDVKCVLMQRHPMEIAASLFARNEIGEAHALALWHTYTDEAEYLCKDYLSFQLDYDELLRERWICVERLLAQLDLNAASLKPQTKQTIDNFLSPNERRQHKKDMLGRVPETPSSTIDKEIDQHPLHYLVDANRLARNGQFVEAVFALRTGLKHHPNHYQLNLRLGGICRQTGARDTARAAFTNAISAHPQKPDAYFQLATLLRDTGLRDEALCNAQKAEKLDPSWQPYSDLVQSILAA